MIAFTIGKIMDIDNSSTIFYKTENSAGWQARWLDLPEEECEKICKQENYFAYKIMDLHKSFFISELQLRTLIVYFDGKYYFPEDEIPYPENDTLKLGEITFSMIWEEMDNDEDRYEDDFNGHDELWTSIKTTFVLPEKTTEVTIVAQCFVEDFPQFLDQLARNKHAVYHNDEYTPYKWIAWEKDDYIRLIHQNYLYGEVKTKFDILLDKEWFYHAGRNMINSMQSYIDSDLKLYEKWKEKHI